ncbi:flavin reductase family protein [Clostridium sp. 19966]|uniref:flavin reductase family protein n=1 Tax=Clostridium sp. 19966 TaxID=2768166 RepID=UPI0028DEFA4B|nr:flavin reductase family protein [Clostridium sp. 19966]MDT8719012.1 flavin reductase family protein [Clostridium sp. 19966]
MKKDLGATLGIYPTPVVIVGAMVNGKPTWTLVAHTGIVSHDSFLVSLAKPHFINQGVKESKALSVNVIDEALLKKADYCGCNSGSKVDKSEVFGYEVGETGAPMIKDAKVVMECTVADIYEVGVFENFILKIVHTFADETIINANGKIDYTQFKPVLFEMPNYNYLSMGDVIAKGANERSRQ